MKALRDFKCPSCGTISPDVPVDVPDQFCPYCGTAMVKVWTANTFILKGSGWPGKEIHAGKAS